jgi:hypothetical protein
MKQLLFALLLSGVLDSFAETKTGALYPLLSATEVDQAQVICARTCLFHDGIAGDKNSKRIAVVQTLHQTNSEQ